MRGARALPGALCLLAAGACGDPGADAGPSGPGQFWVPERPGTVSGYIHAVYDPLPDESVDGAADGGVLLRAGTCAARDGDHAGFAVTLERDGADADPVAGTATTGADGRFSFVDVDPGAYRVSFARDGFLLPATFRVTVAPGEIVSHTPVCALWQGRPPTPADVTLAPDGAGFAVSWTQPAGAVGAVVDRWLVSYGPAPHPDEDVAGCEHHAPTSLRGDAHDVATFAAEGPSPLVTVAPAARLTPGEGPETLVVAVAARDRLGNLSCWSAPVSVDLSHP